MSRIADVLHISDLHLIEDITERGRIHWRKAFGAKSHSYAKIAAMTGALEALRIEGWSPDLLLVTGDVCTDGSQEALQTGLRLVEDRSVRYGPVGRTLTEGLSMNSSRRVILPGNHDRYSGLMPKMDKQNDNLENAFIGAPPGYPYSRGYRQPEHRSNPQSPALLFFIFDSTAMVPAPEDSAFTDLLWRTPFYGAARGRLTPAECRWLVNESQRIADEKTVMGLDGEIMSVEYDAAVRIAVLHHHPVKTSAGDDSLKPTTLMEQHDLFVSKCLEARIDLVLFGHQHKTFSCAKRENSHCTRFFCCPSTAEYSAEDAGFYTFTFYEDYFQITSYRWQGASFVRADAKPPYEYSR